MGKGGAPIATFTPIFLGVGWPRVRGVRRFHNNIYKPGVFRPNIYIPRLMS